ncbi:flagellar motor protein MotA [Indioceanicola profundi]|uniref:flagellar motor protein MotA n=1 Tax=Indioceanicola profundi TaxID=2220096 RepID=UPI000E6AD4D2|nr:flagellar motor protein MotA [Indioceanicola profundi]
MTQASTDRRGPAPQGETVPPLSRPQRYLTRMALFLVIVLGVVAVLLPAIEDAFVANPGLNGLILFALILGIAFIFRQVLMLRPEVQWLESFQAGDPDRAPPPRLLAPMARMLGERQGRLTLSAVTTRSLLDGVGSRLDESREISRYLIGLLIFLGLLGTFWGLLQTVSAVGGVIGRLNMQGDDVGAMFSNLQSGLEAPLSGMGTAFSSSLFGLAGSLVLGFLELQASQAQNRFYTDLEDWLAGATRVSSGVLADAGEGGGSVPAYLQALLETTAESIERLQYTMASAEDGRRSQNAHLMQLTEKLSTLTDQMRAEQHLMVRLAETQMELRPIMGRLAEVLSGGISIGMDEATRTHIRNLEIYTARLLEEATQGRQQTVAELRNEIKILARTIAALGDGER